MKTRLTTSVVLITFNGEKYFTRQLETIALQTRQPDELIICDDGSVDQTLEIAEEFASHASFSVRIFRNEHNLGPGFNFRKGFSLAQGDVTFFCDQDDVWLPQKIAEAMTIFESEPEVGLVLQTDQPVNAEEKPLLGRSFSTSLKCALLKRNDFQTLIQKGRFGWAAHNISCRTSFFSRLFRNAPPVAEVFDQWVFRCMGVFAEVRILTDPSLLFRRHGENATSHSRKTRSPLKLLVRALLRHVQVNRMVERRDSYRQVAEFLENQPELMHPEFVMFYLRAAEHHGNRVRANQNLLLRPWLVGKEWIRGNYSQCSKGTMDAICDLLIPSVKNLTGQERKP